MTPTPRKPRQLSSISGYASRIEIWSLADLAPYYASALVESGAGAPAELVEEARRFAGAGYHNPVLISGASEVVAGGAWVAALFWTSAGEPQRLQNLRVAVIQLDGFRPGIRAAYVHAHAALEAQPNLTATGLAILISDLDREASRFLEEWKAEGDR